MDRIGKLAVIGGGRMGEAIVAGLLAAGAIAPASIVVAETAEARREALAAAHGLSAVCDASCAVLEADTVLLAVKPQVIDEVVAAIAPSLAEGALIVSVAAGVSTARLETSLPSGARVVRVMPNTPALVGAGMSVISGGASASDADVASVAALFDAIGSTVVLPEKLQNAATAVSGSGPAYIAIVIDAMARAGVRQGLARDVAERLAIETVAGTAALLKETGQHPEQLVDGVASPGGTTIAAVEALEDLGLRSAIMGAVAAAAERADELEGR
jgi:pyrroline-5-carboxylate reductase